MGPVGVGKTFLATALGHAAVRRRYSVHFVEGQDGRDGGAGEVVAHRGAHLGGDQGLEVRTPGAVGRNLSADWESNAAS